MIGCVAGYVVWGVIRCVAGYVIEWMTGCAIECMAGCVVGYAANCLAGYVIEYATESILKYVNNLWSNLWSVWRKIFLIRKRKRAGVSVFVGVCKEFQVFRRLK